MGSHAERFCEAWVSSPSTSPRLAKRSPWLPEMPGYQGQQPLVSFCREMLQVERALLRTLVERATERAFHLSSHTIAAGAAGNKTSFATKTSLAGTNLTANTF
jgi:hypothetical protein